MSKVLLSLIVALSTSQIAFGDTLTRLRALGLQNPQQHDFAVTPIPNKPAPTHTVNFSAVLLRNSHWNLDLIKRNLQRTHELLMMCGVGVGEVQLISGEYPETNLTQYRLDCKRYWPNNVKNFHCEMPRNHPQIRKTTAILSQTSQVLNKPTLYFVDDLHGGGEPLGAAYSHHRITREERFLWNQPRTLTPPITPEEQQNLNFFNNILGTGYVSHGTTAEVPMINHPTDINDPVFGSVTAHELVHLLGIPHIEGTFMGEYDKPDQVNNRLCNAIKSSSVVKPVSLVPEAPDNETSLESDT